MTYCCCVGDVLLDLNRLLYYKGGHYISKRELVCSLETLAFHESLHFGFSESFPAKAKTEGDPLHFRGRHGHAKCAEEAAESDVVTFLRRGGISILEALSVKLPDVFAAEILPKLDMTDTLSLAQVNKAYNAAVWSADGVRSMEAKIKAHFVETGRSLDPSTVVLGGKVRQRARGQGLP